MILLLAMLADVSDPLAMSSGMNAIPVQKGVLRSLDMPVPVSDSVRAATWDELAVKPNKVVRVNVACIVLADFGVPGSCLPASKFSADSTTIDWAKARDEFDRIANELPSADQEILRIVTVRLQTARGPTLPVKKSVFAIRFFEEIVSPDDARPPFNAVQRLSMRDIKLNQPIDAGLLAKLYPVGALRSGATARVNMTCDIQANTKLLCRDPGKIELFGADQASNATMVRDFRFATYQFASTLNLQPYDLNGEQVAGKQLSFAIVWKIPGQ